MRQTITEKIFSEHCGKRARSGDILIADVDLCFGQDETGAVIIDSFNKLGIDGLRHKEKSCMVFDHFSPSPNIRVSTIHKKIRDFSSYHNIRVFDVGSGVSHQVISEAGYVSCGDLILGADSHVCTFGALNIFSTGVGASDAAITLASGKNWFKVPETIQIIINGSLKKGVYAKDVILTIVKDFGIDGAAYKAIEFRGEAVEKFSVDSRFTLSNMVVEMGAKCGIMDADKKTADWLKRHSERKPVPVKADSDARYCQIREYDITDLSPRVACPDSPDNVTEVEEVAGRKVDQVFIGSCANGRYEDLEVASKILKNRKVAEGLKLMITPASQGIYKAALKKGLIEIFIKAGAIVNNPGCGPCVGTHQGVPADSEVIFSTSNRNYKGRMGNPEARIYLGSPATAAATAVKGVISDPREHKRRL